MKVASIDIETCGLAERGPDGHLKYDILAFGCVLDDLREQSPIETLPTFSCYFVLPSYTGSPFAFSLHAEIFKRIADRTFGYDFISPGKFGKCFKHFLIHNGYEEQYDKVHINVIGKNFNSLDRPFLSEKTDINKHIIMSHKILDPGPMMFDLNKDYAVPGLSECMKRAGINPNVTHDALQDAIDTLKVVRYCVKNKND